MSEKCCLLWLHPADLCQLLAAGQGELPASGEGWKRSNSPPPPYHPKVPRSEIFGSFRHGSAMAVEQQTLGTSSLLVDVTDTGHGIANPAADLAEADLVEADGKQARLSRSSSLGQDPDQIEVMIFYPPCEYLCQMCISSLTEMC